MALPPIDFAGLAAALLDRASVLVPQWLPDGRLQGHEYVCGSISGGKGSSFSVNLNTGAWADFADDGLRGGDLISLYAAREGKNNAQAALELMSLLGMRRAVPDAAPAPATPPALARAAAPAAAGTAGRRESTWLPIVPVPADTPAPTFRHFHRGEPQAVWEYVFEGQRYGYVCRYATSDGGKEILPYTWCEDTNDPRRLRKWTWKQWEAPRPLYVPAGRLSEDLARPVALVEGEKCAQAGHELLGAEFDWVSWPGGSKAWDKSALGWLMGRTVYLWPDADAKRQGLTKAEREAQVDPASKPLLPAEKQPGMQAMVGIGARLVADYGCTVFLCPVPAPGAVSDGWDVADAIAQGWDADAVRAFLRGAGVFVPPDDAAAPVGDGRSTPSRAGAAPGQDAEAPTWRSRLMRTEKGAVKAVRENAVLCLDGHPDSGLPGEPAVQGVIGFNEFTNDVVKLKAPPWGTGAGVWQEEDELELGAWMAHEQWLPSMPRTTLEEAVVVVSKRHRYHPVREYLASVRGRWDGQRRLSTWLRRVCMVEDEFDDESPLHRYLSRVGTWFVMAMCARVLTPGCKFDFMLILEGAQGVGKSTAARILGGDWFADSGLVLGEKDAYQNLQGIWCYEIGELDAFSRSEVTKVKQFVSSAKDRFRASFDRRAKDYPRQLVFIGTTNEDHYLTDPTGNRRFWPVRVEQPIDLQWLRENRDQLFAEALKYVEAGERFHPTHREQRELFDPQQQARAVEGAIESAVQRYLYDENQKVGMSGENGTLVNEVALIDLLQRVGIGIEKLGPGRFHEKQAASALRKLGWALHRSSKPGRPWVYRRPGVFDTPAPSGSYSTRHDAGAQPAGADSDCPF